MTGHEALVAVKAMLAAGCEEAAATFLSGLIGASEAQKPRSAEAERKARQRERKRLEAGLSGTHVRDMSGTPSGTHVRDMSGTCPGQVTGQVTGHVPGHVPDSECFFVVKESVVQGEEVLAQENMDTTGPTGSTGSTGSTWTTSVQTAPLAPDSRLTLSAPPIAPDSRLTALAPQTALALVEPVQGPQTRSSRQRSPSLLAEPIFEPVRQELVERRAKGDAKRDTRRKLAQAVFEYWQHKLGHERALFDAKRSTRIMRRLEENGDDAGELCYAVDGLFKSHWHRENKHTGIEVVFRDREQVERFAETQGGYTRHEPHPFVEQLGSRARLAIAGALMAGGRIERQEATA